MTQWLAIGSHSKVLGRSGDLCVSWLSGRSSSFTVRICSCLCLSPWSCATVSSALLSPSDFFGPPTNIYISLFIWFSSISGLLLFSIRLYLHPSLFFFLVSSFLFLIIISLMISQPEKWGRVYVQGRNSLFFFGSIYHFLRLASYIEQDRSLSLRAEEPSSLFGCRHPSTSGDPRVGKWPK